MLIHLILFRFHFLNSYLQDAITYSIIGDNQNGISLSYFFIEPTNGTIYLRQSLENNNIDQFTVSIDLRYKLKSRKKL